jgi:hypothetical protein
MLINRTGVRNLCCRHNQHTMNNFTLKFWTGIVVDLDGITPAIRLVVHGGNYNHVYNLVLVAVAEKTNFKRPLTGDTPLKEADRLAHIQPFMDAKNHLIDGGTIFDNDYSVEVTIVVGETDITMKDGTFTTEYWAGPRPFVDRDQASVSDVSPEPEKTKAPKKGKATATKAAVTKKKRKT